jgi:RNA polymerase sigma-70 factor (ECF subfamily)
MTQARLADLMDKVATGDQAALRQLYTLTSAKLFGVCLRVAQDRSGAEEALQDAYIKIWRKAGYFDTARASPIAWMCAIARNCAIDWRRAQAHVPQPLDDAAISDLVPREPLADSDQQHHLLDCVAGLKDAESRAVRFAFYEGLSHSELAARLALPLGTLKSLMRRAILALRKCVDDGD